MLVSAPGLGIRPALALTTTIGDAAAGAIPDPAAWLSCTSSLTRTFTVSTNLIISDVNFAVNITHPRRSDVRVTLTSPSGTSVMLISGGGLGSPVIASPDDYDNYDVLLDDSSISSLYTRNAQPGPFIRAGLTITSADPGTISVGTDGCFAGALTCNVSKRLVQNQPNCVKIGLNPAMRRKLAFDSARPQQSMDIGCTRRL